MKKLVYLVMILCSVTIAANIWAAKPKADGEELQRSAYYVFDTQRNTVSNFDFYTTNYGIMGLDVAKGTGGGFWPRGSQNEYLFGSGLWLAGKKQVTIDGTKQWRKMVEVSYNPNSGKSWFVPGRIEDGDSVANSLKDMYRIYYSTDIDHYTGVPLNAKDGPNWPLWIDDTTGRYQYGTYHNKYVHSIFKRNRTEYPFGPLIVSDEDIVSTFKDTDLDKYEGGATSRKQNGYPMRLQVESSIYSWGATETKDVVLQSYIIKNMSKDTLMDCWLGGVFDVDIAYFPNATMGAGNDRVQYFNDDSTLNLVVGWSGTDQGEEGKGFGYIGISMLETPAIDANGNIRTDKMVFEPYEQLGLKTFRSWPISTDYNDDESRYNALSTNTRDIDTVPGDKRVLVATGPFNLKPGDEARLVYSIAFALPAKGGEADGTYEDLTGFQHSYKKSGDNQLLANSSSLIGKLNTVKTKYYESVIPASAADEPSLNFNIGDVYPNPVNSKLNISYNLQNAGSIKISLIDQLGEEISVLSREWEEPGRYDKVMNIDNHICNGVYFLRLQAGQNVQIRQVVVAR